jgi:acyl-CoA thioester hydrolase
MNGGRLEAERFILPVRVYYEDTDAAGIVYYANYLKYIERARTELLRFIGVDQSELRRETGLAFAVKNCTLDYIAPARLDDALEVRSRLSSLKGASLVADQEIYRRDERLFTAEVRCVCFEVATGRPGRIPAQVREALSRLAAETRPGEAAAAQ